VNGTSGYEEAAAQGLVAGINAAAKIVGKKELVLKRSEAYIGVLVDDLVGKSTDEPYRIFTSRAEHRLLLRQDNADRRLSKYGHYYGLISDEEIFGIGEAERKIFGLTKFLHSTKIKPDAANQTLRKKKSSEIEFSESLAQIIKRPEIKISDMIELVPAVARPEGTGDEYILTQTEMEIKAEGYIKHQNELIKKMEKYEELKIPLNFNYSNLKTLSMEGREKLTRVKPRSLGQASRISGVTPSDISILLVYLKK
jgi:tRNA uridine 5-carboxymethylaminomethyl modification enzyme